MKPPCNNCGKDACHFCHLAKTDPRYARLYCNSDLPFSEFSCVHRGDEVGRTKCESCGGNVEVKIFSCQRHGSCSLEKDVGHKTCAGCNDKTPLAMHHAYDWKDLGQAVYGDSRKFNSSLLRFKGQLVLATRIHTKEGWSAGNITLTRLDDSFQRQGKSIELLHGALFPKATERIGVACAMGIEDPRLFEHRGQLHMAFTGVEVKDDGAVTNQLYARLTDDLQIEEVFEPYYPGRQEWEKNWGFFSEGGELYAVYQIRGHKILRITGNSAELVYQSETEWPETIGEPRGGASPIKRGNEWYSFFHDVRDVDGRRQYNLCLYTFEDKAPFRINRIGNVPLFSPTLSHCPNKQFIPDVVFPCGAFLEDNLWHVSAGYYDWWSFLLRFDINKTEFLLERAKGGRDYDLAIRPEVDDWIIWNDVYNNNEYQLPQSLEGAVVVDIGGHIGSFARLCLDRGASHVLSIEPNPSSAETYRRNLAGYNGKATLLEGAAFGKPPESASLIGAGCGCQVRTDGEGIPVEPLDIGPIDCDLMKLDCEGAEYEIVENADLSRVKRIAGEGHLFQGLPGIAWLREKLEAKGFKVRIHETGSHTFLFWAERAF